MKRYHGVSPLEQKRSMPAWLAKPSFVIGLLIVLVVILMALFPQFIAPYDPIATDVTVSNQAPSAAHWFGTDFYGRDIFSRVIWGTRIDLLIGVLGVVIPFLVGGMIGLLAGYYGGFLDSLLMRITDIMMAFPFTILVITIMAILGQGLINLFIALWLVGWMSYAKLVRSEVLVLKDSEFIQAARVAGFSDARILFRHLLPNVISSAVVFAASDVTVSNQAPSAAHWFGTDFYGRDIFSRVIWGTRIDLLIGVLGVVIPFLVGGMIGLLAGYYGGFLDSLLMRITDIMMAFPFTILVITIMAILGQGLINLFIALWLVGWMSYAKLVRSEVLVLKDSEFIQAARVAGFSDARILFRHLLPNVISSAVVFAASDVVMCMLTGASMSFLGLGVSPPTPEWGSILNEGRNFITFAWWPTLFPGLFLAVSGVGFSLLGDGLTDFLRTKGR